MLKPSLSDPIPAEISPFKLNELQNHVGIALPTEDIPGMMRRLSIQASSSEDLTSCSSEMDRGRKVWAFGCLTKAKFSRDKWT